MLPVVMVCADTPSAPPGSGIATARLTVAKASRDHRIKRRRPISGFDERQVQVAAPRATPDQLLRPDNVDHTRRSDRGPHRPAVVRDVVAQRLVLTPDIS